MKYNISDSAQFFTATNNKSYDTNFATFIDNIKTPIFKDNKLVQTKETKITKSINPFTFKDVPTNITPVLESDKYLNYFNDEGDIIYSTFKGGALRKMKCNIKTVNILTIDFDDITDPNHIHEVHSKLKPYNHFIHQSYSYGTSKNGKTVYNFKLWLELDTSVGAVLWPYLSSLLIAKIETIIYHDNDQSILSSTYNNIRNWLSDSSLRTIKDISSNQCQRHQSYPATSDKEAFIALINLGATPLSTYKEFSLVQSLIKEDKTLQIERAEKTESYSKKQSYVGGKLNPDKNILSQIEWTNFNIDRFISKSGLNLRQIGDKYIGQCSQTHNSGNNDSEFYISESTDGTWPTVHCAHNCRYHGAGSTTRFLEDYSHCIDDNCIKTSISFIVDDSDLITALPPTTPSNDQLDAITKRQVGDVNEIFDSATHATMGQASTGSGKSTKSALKILSNHDKKWLYICSSLDEMQQMQDVLLQNGANKAYIHLLSSEDNKIKDNATIVITHYYYTLRKGHSARFYNLTLWVKENKPMIICDEIDAYFDIAFREINLQQRYMFDEKTKKYYKTDKCVSGNAGRNYFACDNCHIKNRIWVDNSHGNDIYNWHSIASAHDMLSPDLKIIDTTPSVQDSNVVKESILHNSKLHKLVYKDLRFHSGTIDNPFDDKSAWIDDIVSTSLYAYKISTNKNLKEDFTKRYYNLYAEVKRLNPNLEHDAIAQATNKQLNKTKTYPLHACGIEKLCWLDTAPMKYIINNCEKIYFLSATISPWQLSSLKKLCGSSFTFCDVKGTGWQPVKNLLLILTSQQLDVINNWPSIIKSSDITSIGTRKTYVITEAKSDIEKLKEKHHDAKRHIAFFDGEKGLASFSSSIRNRQWSTLYGYKRAAIGRGINLGEYSCMYLDFNANKSMNVYDYGQIEDLSKNRLDEHMRILAQNAGRIMRKPMADDGSLIDDSPNKVIIIHGCMYDETDLTHELASILQNLYEPMCSGRIDIKIMPLPLKSSTFTDNIASISNEYIKTATVLNINEEIPKEYYEKSWSDYADNHIIKQIITEDTFLNQKKMIKYRKKLEEINLYIKTTYNDLLCLTDIQSDIRHKFTWKRLKDAIPNELMGEYLNIFENK